MLRASSSRDSHSPTCERRFSAASRIERSSSTCLRVRRRAAIPAGEVGEETDVLERSGNPLLHDLVGFTARDVLFDGVYACKFLSRFMELVSRPLLLLMP
jgi:hypothetical protein